MRIIQHHQLTQLTNFPNMDVNVTAQEYVLQSLENIEKAREFAHENLEERKTKRLKKNNRERENSYFSVWDMFIYMPGITRKLKPPWTSQSTIL